MGQQFLKVAVCPSFCTSETSDSKHSHDDLADDDLADEARSRPIIIASVREQPETLAAMRKIFTLLKFPTKEYPFIFIADFKLLNIIFGLSTNASTYPCVFCEIDLTISSPLAYQSLLENCGLSLISNSTLLSLSRSKTNTYFIAAALPSRFRCFH